MRSNYSDEEIVALAGIMQLLSAEIGRNTKVIISDLDHLLVCETAEHRAAVVAQAKTAISNILSHLRYCSWIEAELTSTRVFAEPVKYLADLVKQQEEIAETFREKVDPAPEPESVPLLNQPVVQEVAAFTSTEQSEAMNKLANVPFKNTLQ